VELNPLVRDFSTVNSIGIQSAGKISGTATEIKANANHNYNHSRSRNAICTNLQLSVFPVYINPMLPLSSIFTLLHILARRTPFSVLGTVSSTCSLCPIVGFPLLLTSTSYYHSLCTCQCIICSRPAISSPLVILNARLMLGSCTYMNSEILHNCAFHNGPVRH
jgi:hypothetical protein